MAEQAAPLMSTSSVAVRMIGMAISEVSRDNPEPGWHAAAMATLLARGMPRGGWRGILLDIAGDLAAGRIPPAGWEAGVPDLEVPFSAVLTRAPVRCPECCARYLCVAAAVDDPVEMSACLAMAHAHAADTDTRDEMARLWGDGSIGRDDITRLIEMAGAATGEEQ